MTKDDIIKLAREAQGTPYVNRHYPGVTSFGFHETTLERFANLVASKEREECAKVCEDASGTGKIISCKSAAKAIRARTKP